MTGLARSSSKKIHTMFSTVRFKKDGTMDVKDESWEQFSKRVERNARRVRSGLRYDDQNNTLTLAWNYPYEIDLDEIKTHSDLIHWLSHLMSKTWMTRERLRAFVEAVTVIKGWDFKSTHVYVQSVNEIARGFAA